MVCFRLPVASSEMNITLKVSVDEQMTGQKSESWTEKVL